VRGSAYTHVMHACSAGWGSFAVVMDPHLWGGGAGCRVGSVKGYLGRRQGRKRKAAREIRQAYEPAVKALRMGEVVMVSLGFVGLRYWSSQEEVDE
jgi:hypothetical protein